MEFSFNSDSVVTTSFNADSSVAFIIASNYSRRLLTIYNSSQEGILIGFGFPPTTDSFTLRLFGNMYYETPIPVYTGIIWGKFETVGPGGINVNEFS